ncbi:cation diffusion facilitator family transporter [Candidatus Stoquefichus massiliensis]|uniref:cation diffusion facilitator family transporter n=1 Tax=Candidatus Stoquefichus massiliensis TaxID=1470350 RepID=UPI00048092B9|nr:cation diffusion facilitator family transporter [Candidatus Stoquefichus massiliensis]
MFTLIVKKFINNYQDTSSPKVREKYGIVCSVLSIVCNGLMVIFKLMFGFITKSVAIQADGFNNLSDMGSNLAALFGFKMAGKHPDADHPYGHGRYEYITGLVIAFLILLVAFSSLKESMMKIIQPETIHFQITAVIVLVVSILTKFWMAAFNRKASELIQSTSLKAAAQDSLNDVVTTLATLISLCLSLVTDWPIDGIIGLVVSLFVLKSGIDIFKDTVDPLLGQAPDKELVNEIYEFVRGFDKVIGIHDFMMHDYGPGRKYMTFHAEVDSRENIMEIHDQIDLIERELLEKFNILTTIHMDPIDMNDELTKELRDKVSMIVNQMNNQYSIHDFRIVSGPTHTNLIFDVLIPASDEIAHRELKAKIENEVKKLSPSYFCVIQIDHAFI